MTGMILGYRNALVSFCSYTFEGGGNTSIEAGETDVFSVIFWTIYTGIVIILLSWWLIPLRWLLTSYKFR